MLPDTATLFACRHCHRQAYASQNETPSLRAIRRVRKIRMRLGAGFSLAISRHGFLSGASPQAVSVNPVVGAASLRCRGGEAGFDQKEVPNNLLANEPSLSTQGAGGNCGS
jgi:hypothetical protein